MVREYFSTRTNQQGQLVSRKEDECAWHRLDILRFRIHPCFRLPSDVPLNVDDSIQVWPVEDGRVLITAATGVAFIEIYPEAEDELCHAWIDYNEGKPELKSASFPSMVVLTETDLRQRLPETSKGKKLRIEVYSGGFGKQTVDDFGELVSKSSHVDIPEMRMYNKRGGLNKLILEKRQKGYKSQQLGFSSMEGTKPDEVILDQAHVRNKLMTCIKVYHGFAIDGIEFFYSEGESQLFGKRGGKEGGDAFFLGMSTRICCSVTSLLTLSLDTRRSELLMGFHVRAGQWIDGIQLLTTQGRKSEFYGNPNGGSA